MTKGCAATLALFRISLFGFHSSFVIRISSLSGVCFSFLISHIPRPDEPAHQSAPGRLRTRGVAHGVGNSDATPEERRPRRGLWRRGHGKHFWRANHERFGEVYGMAGGYLFRAHLRVVDPLCP